jgi:hypothetical protein
MACAWATTRLFKRAASFPEGGWGYSQISIGGGGGKFCLMTFKPFKNIFTDHSGVQGRK